MCSLSPVAPLRETAYAVDWIYRHLIVNVSAVILMKKKLLILFGGK